jgi:DNA polymerase III subunit epsilon
MSWADGPMVAFDLETTGVDPETARIVTATVVLVRPGCKPAVHDWVCAPDVEIPAEATRVHGITTEFARQFGIPTARAVAEIADLIKEAADAGHPLVIYNAPYDLTVLDREVARNHLAAVGPLPHVVDPLVIDRALDKYRPGSRKLTDVCRHYGITLKADEAHTSKGDAIAAARLAWKLAKAYPTHLADIAALQETQAVWYRAWAEHFQEYLRGKGSGEVIDTAWPVRPAAAEVTT